MFKFFIISCSELESDDSAWLSDVDSDGRCILTSYACDAMHFNSFDEASHLASLIDCPYVFVTGVFVNE